MAGRESQTYQNKATNLCIGLLRVFELDYEHKIISNTALYTVSQKNV